MTDAVPTNRLVVAVLSLIAFWPALPASAQGVASTDWKDHGAYVSCVAHASNDFRTTGLITDAEKGAIVSTSAQSGCGKKGGN